MEGRQLEVHQRISETGVLGFNRRLLCPLFDLDKHECYRTTKKSATLTLLGRFDGSAAGLAFGDVATAGTML